MTLARIIAPILLLLVAIAAPAAAQAQTTRDAPPALSTAEIDQLLAPIALYPDVLLSQVLMAATYPLEVVQAARWAADNPGLSGDAAVNAADRETDWDPSVTALVAFPEVLQRMDEDLEWTQRLGEAFLFQEEEVMARVQELRQRAYASGSLQGLDRVRVSRGDEIIVIEPASTQLIYVPWYDPRIVYGGWWWSGYPPYYWAPPGVHLGVGFHWGRAVRVSSGFFFSTVHWPRRSVVIIDHYRPFYARPYRDHRDYYSGFRGAPRWSHDPRHRHGIGYRDRDWRPPPRIGRPPPPSRVERRSIIRDERPVERRQAPVPRTQQQQPRSGVREERRSIHRSPGPARQAPRSERPRATSPPPRQLQSAPSGQGRGSSGASGQRQGGGGGAPQRRDSILR